MVRRRCFLEAVAQSRWVLVTQDRRIRKRAAERDALIQHGVRAFFIASTANLSAAETTDVPRRAQAAMATALDELEAPFVVAIYKEYVEVQLWSDEPVLEFLPQLR